MIDFIDCYGLAGGPTLGAVQAGFSLVSKKSPEGWGVRECEANRHLLSGPWTPEIRADGLWETHSGVPFVFGCPPCSGFSGLNTSKGVNVRGIDSPINDCMKQFAMYVGRQRPEVAIFESVQAAGKMGRPLMQQLRAMVEAGSGLKYDLTHVFMSGASVGAAQTRKRYFWAVHRIPFGVESPRPRQVFTYHDAMGDLMRLPLDYRFQLYTDEALGPFSEGLRAELGVDGHDYPRTRHAARAGSIAEGWLNGESWEKQIARYEDIHGRLPDVWGDDYDLAQLTRPRMGGGTRRPHPDRSGWVLTGSAGNAYLHYALPRLLTVRECARLMGYPDAWNWAGTSPNQAFARLGKNVPVQSGRWAAGWARRAIEGRPGAYQGTLIGDRERLIDVTHDYKEVYDERTGERRDTRSQVWIKEMEARPA